MKPQRIAALALLGIAAACAEGTGPNVGNIDAQRVKQGIAVVERVAASKLLGSLHAVGRAANDVGAAQSAMGWSPGLENAVRKLSTAAVSSGTALIPVMRSSVLGTTFIYDPAARKYVPDPHAQRRAVQWRAFHSV